MQAPVHPQHSISYVVKYAKFLLDSQLCFGKGLAATVQPVYSGHALCKAVPSLLQPLRLHMYTRL